MNMKIRKLLAAGGVFLAAASFAACGSAASSNMKGDSFVSHEQAASEDYYGDYEEEWGYEETAPAEAAGGSSSVEKDKFVIESDQKLVYSCNISIETVTFDDSVKNIKALVRKYEGFIESETQSDSDYDWYYSSYKKTTGSLTEYLTVRIPTVNYDDFMAELEGNGKVRSKNQSVDNITKAYRDTETTISSLKIEEERLLAMMDQCVTIEEMITVEDRLSEVQNELAMYESNLKSMDLDIAYSTVSIDLKEVLEYKPDTNPVYTNTFAQRLLNTIIDSWEGFLDFLEGFLFFLIYAFPVVMVFGVIFCAIFFPIRYSVKKKKAAKIAAQQAVPDYTDEN